MLNPFDTYSQRIVTKPADIQKEMVIAVKLDAGSYSYYRNLQVPITSADNGVVQNHNVRIDWGDGQTTEIEAGIAIPKNRVTHNYSSNGWKTITITSEDGGLDRWNYLGATNFKYWISSTRGLDCQLQLSPYRYETPLLRIDGGSQTSLGDYNSQLEYIDPYLFKNNAHLTEIYIYLNNYKTSESDKGSSFVLERNILLDVPNITRLDYIGDLIYGPHNFNKEDLFINNKKLKRIIGFSDYYNFPDKNFPNFFKHCPDLEEIYRGRYYTSATTEQRDQIHTIPEDLFRYCPKLYRAAGLFSDSVTNLDATNISFTKGGFFAPNWEPNPEETLDLSYMFCNKVANTLNKSSATEFVDTIKSLGVNYDCEGALYNQTGMVGYSSIPSAFKTNPY